MIKSFFGKLFAQALSFLTPVRVIVLAICFLFIWFLGFGDQGIKKLWLLISMRNQLNAQRHELNGRIDALSQEKETLSSPENLEMVIRKELGYIKPGEVIFETKGSNLQR